ncbi:MAG: hypothetical protein KUL87_07325 [Pseudomonas sp.]|nr:hypothetical protein [Pseudomonas sp.]
MPIILATEQFGRWLSPSTCTEQVHRATALSRQAFRRPPSNTGRQEHLNDYPEPVLAIE